MFNEELGRRLQKYRTNRGITQTEMARLCQTTQSYLSSIEKGKHVCNAEIVSIYSKTLNISADILLGTEVDNYIIPSLVELLNKLSVSEQNELYKFVQNNHNSVK